MKKNISFITYQHLINVASENEAKMLFKKSVKMVEVEVFSYCNRKCSFCPNYYIDRTSENIFMNEQVYLKLLSELSQIDYNNTISYSRYNEPLADKIILTRINQARTILPKAKLHTNTNGDYLTKEYLEELYHSGLNSLKIQVYLPNNEPYNDKIVINRIKDKLEKIGLPYQFEDHKPGIRHKAKIIYKNMDIQIYSRNFEETGCSRGNLVDIRKDYQRVSPCFSPFASLYLDYNGMAVPCCNIRSDAKEHKDFIVGNIENNTIFEIYSSGPLVKWRQSLINFGPKQIPCDTCRFEIIKKGWSYFYCVANIKVSKFLVKAKTKSHS